MELSDLEKIRVDKIERMRAAGIDAYPTRAEVTHTIAEASRLFEAAARSGARITSVDIQEPNLEAVFLHLTGKALRD